MATGRSPFNLPPGEINKKATRIIKDIRLIPLPRARRTPLFSLSLTTYMSGLHRFIPLVKLDYGGVKTLFFKSVKRNVADYCWAGANGRFNDRRTTTFYCLRGNRRPRRARWRSPSSSDCALKTLKACCGVSIKYPNVQPTISK